MSRGKKSAFKKERVAHGLPRTFDLPKSLDYNFKLSDWPTFLDGMSQRALVVFRVFKTLESAPTYLDLQAAITSRPHIVQLILALTDIDHIYSKIFKVKPVWMDNNIADANDFDNRLGEFWQLARQDGFLQTLEYKLDTEKSWGDDDFSNIANDTQYYLNQLKT